MSGQKVYRWYKEVLSGFNSPVEQTALHQYDLEVKEKGKVNRIRVPIMKPENMGEDMAIDEKQINGEVYTILSNRRSGKIALMAQSLKAKILCQIGLGLGDKRFWVKSVTRDLAANYDWVCRELFMNAQQIGDKFHVLKLGFEALQALRIRFRQEELSLKRAAFEAHKEAEDKRRKKYEKRGWYFTPKKFRPKEETFSNGDTRAQLLARSRYLLFKQKQNWSDSQWQRAAILFKQYPVLKKAYEHICWFRNWYDKNQIGKSNKQKREALIRWYARVDKSNISEIENFKTTIERHQGVILNYFSTGYTNAYAEALNAKIQRLITNNFGVRNLDFFLFRLKGYFS